MAIREELLDELLKEYKNPEDLTGKDGILKQLLLDILCRLRTKIKNQKIIDTIDAVNGAFT